MKIGTAVDYGICKGIRKDGARCSMAINSSLGEYCEYHVQAVFKQKVASRMDLNRGSFTPSGPREARPKGSGRSKVRKAQPTSVSAETLAKQSKNHVFMRALQAKAEQEERMALKVAEAARNRGEKANSKSTTMLSLTSFDFWLTPMC